MPFGLKFDPSISLGNIISLGLFLLGIVQSIRSAIKKHLAKQDELIASVDEMRRSLTTLTSDMSHIHNELEAGRSEMGTLQQDVRGVKDDVRSMKDDVKEIKAAQKKDRDRVDQLSIVIAQRATAQPQTQS